MRTTPNGSDDIRGALSIRRFGEVYSVGHTKTYELIKTGQLRAIKLGARTLITRKDAEDFLSRLPTIGANR